MQFFVGLHKPRHARHFDCAFVSANQLRRRRKPLGARQWILDSGAFTEISTYGEYRFGVAEYAELINRLAAPNLIAAVSQDFMCEPFILQKTGLTIADHQRLTIERYDQLLPLVSTYIIPVLQGYAPADYVRHLVDYGERLVPGAWVGVGSLCKRNTSIGEIERILIAIKTVRPDMRLHGFGLKITALGSALVRDQLYSADSMAWSFAARKQGRNQNCWREAEAFVAKIATMPTQTAWNF